MRRGERLLSLTSMGPCTLNAVRSTKWTSVHEHQPHLLQAHIHIHTCTFWDLLYTRITQQSKKRSLSQPRKREPERTKSEQPDRLSLVDSYYLLALKNSTRITQDMALKGTTQARPPWGPLFCRVETHHCRFCLSLPTAMDIAIRTVEFLAFRSIMHELNEWRRASPVTRLVNRTGSGVVTRGMVSTLS